MSCLRRPYRSLVVTGAVLAAVLMAATALAEVTPRAVIAGKGLQGFAFANDANIVWTSNTPARPKHYDAYAIPRSGGSKVKLNAAGSQGYTGGFDPTTNTVIYQQIENGRSDIYWFDLDTSTRSSVPGVNSRRWEWSPRVSTSHILFERDYRRNGTWYTSVYLFDRATSSTRLLDTWTSPKHFVQTGNLGEAYATWSVCTAKTCFAYLYTIASQTMQRIPTKNKRPQYSPALDEANGRVYFVRSGVACGAGVTIFRVPADNLSATPTKILALPPGIDVEYVMSLAPNANGTDRDLLFERVICEPFESDVYQADAVNTVPDA